MRGALTTMRSSRLDSLYMSDAGFFTIIAATVGTITNLFTYTMHIRSDINQNRLEDDKPR